MRTRARSRRIRIARFAEVAALSLPVPQGFLSGWATTRFGATHYWQAQQVGGSVFLTSACGKSTQAAEHLRLAEESRRCRICERASGVR